MSRWRESGCYGDEKTIQWVTFSVWYEQRPNCFPSKGDCGLEWEEANRKDTTSLDPEFTVAKMIVKMKVKWLWKMTK